MRKDRLKFIIWYLASVSTISVLLAFYYYIAGYISPHYCSVHKTTRMRRVRITYNGAKFLPQQYVEFGLPGLDYHCVPGGSYNSIKESENFYLYCPQCLPKVGDARSTMCG